MTLDWMIGTNDHWCSFKTIDFDSDCFGNDLRGVFIVWYAPAETEEGRVVQVGHGVLKIKLAALREEPLLARYYKRDLLVTWAEVDRQHQASVEEYLIAVLSPIFNERHPNVVQTIVNLPAW